MRLAILFILVINLSNIQAETLFIGTTGYYPPFVIDLDKDHYTGFDIDLFNEICHRLSMQCKTKALGFKDIFTSINDGNIDVAVGGVIISPEREQQYLFSLPYKKSSGEFLIRYKDKIHSFADLRGKKFGVANNSVFKQWLENTFHNSIIINTYNNLSEMLLALTSGKVDILLLDKATADFWYSNDSNTYDVFGTSIPMGSGYGIMTSLGRPDLISKVNKALLSMEDDGTYLKIYKTYFISD